MLELSAYASSHRALHIDVTFIVPQVEGERVFYIAFEGRVVNGELGDHQWECCSHQPCKLRQLRQQTVPRQSLIKNEKLRAQHFARRLLEENHLCNSSWLAVWQCQHSTVLQSHEAQNFEMDT